MKSLNARVENLEQKINLKGEKGCDIIIVTYDGFPPVPEGAADRYLEENGLCVNCNHKDRPCVLWWNGLSISKKDQGS